MIINQGGCLKATVSTRVNICKLRKDDTAKEFFVLRQSEVANKYPVIRLFQIFRRFEYPAERHRLTSLSANLVTGRRNFLATVINSQNLSITFIEPKLHQYEVILRDALAGGIDLQKDVDAEELEKWTLLKAVFFSSTVLTTIGNAWSMSLFCTILRT